MQVYGWMCVCNNMWWLLWNVWIDRRWTRSTKKLSIHAYLVQNRDIYSQRRGSSCVGCKIVSDINDSFKNCDDKWKDISSWEIGLLISQFRLKYVSLSKGFFISPPFEKYFAMPRSQIWSVDGKSWSQREAIEEQLLWMLSQMQIHVTIWLGWLYKMWSIISLLAAQS